MQNLLQAPPAGQVVSCRLQGESLGLLLFFIVGQRVGQRVLDLVLHGPPVVNTQKLLLVLQIMPFHPPLSVWSPGRLLVLGDVLFVHELVEHSVVLLHELVLGSLPLM